MTKQYGVWRLPVPILLFALVAVPLTARAALATAPVTQAGGAATYRADGVVEAEQQAQVAAQVPGRITRVLVKVGDRVPAGAPLALIDARAAQDQQHAAQAQLAAARRDYQRSRELFAQNYISKAAMDRAEAQYRVLEAQARIATTQRDFHRIAAPYAGVVSAVMVETGDMAQPGRPLFTFYDPTRLRVTVQVPESTAASIDIQRPVSVEISGADAAHRDLVASRVLILPTADAVAHTREVRLELPAGTAVIPGAFARAQLPLAGKGPAQLLIPASAVVTRSEFQGVYVVDANGYAQLRQVRIGQRRGDMVEVLSGLNAGERVAVDPLAALNQPAPGGGASHD